MTKPKLTTRVIEKITTRIHLAAALRIAERGAVAALAADNARLRAELDAERELAERRAQLLAEGTARRASIEAEIAALIGGCNPPPQTLEEAAAIVTDDYAGDLGDVSRADAGIYYAAKRIEGLL